MIVLKGSIVLEKQAVKWKWKYWLKKVNTSEDSHTFR